jgi:hypothetical protein
MDGAKGHITKKDFLAGKFPALWTGNFTFERRTDVSKAGVNLIIFNNYKKQADSKKMVSMRTFAFYMPY